LVGVGAHRGDDHVLVRARCATRPRRRRVQAAVLIIGLASTGLAFSTAASGKSPASGSATACKPGTTKVPGGVKRTFCGTAKATVKVNGRSYAFAKGRCELYPGYVSVEIGRFSRGGSFFALLVGKSPDATAEDPPATRDGIYTKGTFGLAVPTFGSIFHDETDLKIALRKGRRAGAFSATDPANARFKRLALQVTGSFSCTGK
jgi:hypothetical protein